MTQIPIQLSKYRFIKTHRKTAIEKAWPIELKRFKIQHDGTYIDTLTNLPYKSKGQIYKGSIHSYDYNDMNEELELAKIKDPNTITYGVLGGYNGLVIIDIDDKVTANKLLNEYPFNKTFTTLSGSKGLPHFYFKCEDYSNPTKYDKNKKRIIDVQARSKYVVGPNSKIRSNNIIQEYKISNEADVLEINYRKLLNILEEVIGDYDKIQKKEENVYTDKYFDIDPIADEIFSKISCTDVLAEFNVDVSSNPGDTPFAESDGQKCLHRTGHVWYDHHIGEGGTVIQLYAKLYKMDSIKAKFELAEKVGVKEKIFKQALQYFIKNKTHEMTELLSMKFLSTTPTYTIRSDKSRSPEIYIYKDGIYIPNGITYIQEFCDTILGKWYTQTIVNKITDKIVVRTLIDAEEFFKETDATLLPVQNGILNIVEKKLYEFTPNYKFFNKLPVKYEPLKKCDVTLKHLKTVLSTDNDILVMQELYGYSLFRCYPFEKAFLFFGEGRNGKSKTIEQMKSLLGDYNIVNLSLQQLQLEKFSRCNLHGKLANLADDIGNAKLEETQMFKQLTGGSAITVDRKHLTSLTFKNYAKMIFSANKIPDTVDNSDGFWNRWVLIGFTKKFIPQTEYNNLLNKGKLKPHYRVADTDIIKKLTTEDELSGVLNWALEGYNRLMEQNGFSVTNGEQEIKQIWRRNVSNVIAFSQDKIIKTYNPEEYVDSEKLYLAYSKYCQRKEILPDSTRIFTKKLTEENIICQRKRIATGHEYRWLGIKLLEE